MHSSTVDDMSHSSTLAWTFKYANINCLLNQFCLRETENSTTDPYTTNWGWIYR